jgi:hypothetical protein
LRQIAAILLLGILLFNWCGYCVFEAVEAWCANAKLESELDENNYDETSLLLIKMPVAGLPYYTNSLQFERVDGQIDISGVSYHFVKRRIYNDSVELFCIPNKGLMNLQKATDNFFKSVNGLQAGNQTKKSAAHSVSRNFTPDYLTTRNPVQLGALPCLDGPQYGEYQLKFSSTISSKPERPPQVI